MNLIQSANLIPEEFLKEKISWQNAKTIAKWIYRISFLLFLGIALVLALCYYQTVSRDMDVPEQIRSDFQTAQANMELIQKKNELYQKAVSSDSKAVSTLSALLASKPAEIRFTKIEITSAKELQLEGFAQDPATINTYVEALNGSGYFNKAVAEKITSATNDQYKTFTIHLEKKN